MTPTTTDDVPHVSIIDFWTCDPDAERLTHEELEEAVEMYLDDADDLENLTWPLEVYGWRRRGVSDKDLEGLGVSLAERAEEWLDEEFGGDDHCVFEDLGQERLARACIEALKAARSAGEITPWQCEVVETREVTLEQARSWFPQWFEPTRSLTAPGR